jgi:hypothetical protein
MACETFSSGLPARNPLDEHAAAEAFVMRRTHGSYVLDLF